MAGRPGTAGWGGRPIRPDDHRQRAPAPTGALGRRLRTLGLGLVLGLSVLLASRPGLALNPKDREAVGEWVGQFAGEQVQVAVEACTGWLFVYEVLAGAGVMVHLAEPAEASALIAPDGGWFDPKLS